MKLLAFAAVFLAAAYSAHAEEKYRCKDFVTDFMSAPSDKQLNPRSNPNLAMSAGFIMGTYYTKTGEDFENLDTSGLGEFEKKVVAECSAHPEARVPLTVLSAATSLKASLPKARNASAGAGYEVISLTDLKLDAKQMQGKKVEVTGVLSTMGDIAMIGDSLFGANKLFVENKKLSRDDRKYVLENCEGGCNITVRGKVGSVMLNDGIIAEALVIP